MENTDIASVAKQYRGDGYRVIVHPAKSNLPDILSGFRPDMLAQKEGENVVIEVVTKDRMNKRKHFLEYWVGKVNAQPGWRFDLIITDSSPWADKILQDARERDVEEIRERNREVRSTLEQGFLEPACLFAWALIESAMRTVARSLESPLKNNMPSYVMKQLYAVGAISNTDLEKLQRLMTIRNSVAHGLKTSKLTGEVIAEMMKTTEKLLSVAESAKRRVAGAQ